MNGRNLVLAAAAFFAAHFTQPASAQTVGYAEAIDQLGTSCGADIAKFCKNESLGGDRVRQCLQRNSGSVSPRCIASISALTSLLEKRAAARASVMKVCDVDIKRRCSGVEVGDGNLLECFFKTKENVSAPCRQAVADAGFEVGLASPSTTSAPIKLTPGELVNSLQGVEAPATRSARRSCVSLPPNPLPTRPAKSASIERPCLRSLTSSHNSRSRFSSILIQRGSVRIPSGPWASWPTLYILHTFRDTNFSSSATPTRREPASIISS